MWYAAVCRIDVMTATQLLIITTRFPRDIGTSGHWNPDFQSAQEENGYRPENRERAPTRGTVFFYSGTSLAITGGLSAARSVDVLPMEVTTSWAGARSGSLFHEALGRGSNIMHWGSLVSWTQTVCACGRGLWI